MNRRPSHKIPIKVHHWFTDSQDLEDPTRSKIFTILSLKNWHTVTQDIWGPFLRGPKIRLKITTLSQVHGYLANRHPGYEDLPFVVQNKTENLRTALWALAARSRELSKLQLTLKYLTMPFVVTGPVSTRFNEYFTYKSIHYNKSSPREVTRSTAGNFITVYVQRSIDQEISHSSCDGASTRYFHSRAVQSSEKFRGQLRHRRDNSRFSTQSNEVTRTLPGHARGPLHATLNEQPDNYRSSHKQAIAHHVHVEWTGDLPIRTAITSKHGDTPRWHFLRTSYRIDRTHGNIT